MPAFQEKNNAVLVTEAALGSHPCPGAVSAQTCNEGTAGITEDFSALTQCCSGRLSPKAEGSRHVCSTSPDL